MILRPTIIMSIFLIFSVIIFPTPIIAINSSYTYSVVIWNDTPDSLLENISFLGNVSLDRDIYTFTLQNIDMSDNDIRGDLINNDHEFINKNISIKNKLLWNYSDMNSWLLFANNSDTKIFFEVEKNLMVQSYIVNNLNTTIFVDIVQQVTFKVIMSPITSNVSLEFWLQGYSQVRDIENESSVISIYSILDGILGGILVVILIIVPLIKIKFIKGIILVKNND